VRRWQDDKGHERLSLATRSHLPLREQITAPDHLARSPVCRTREVDQEADAITARTRLAHQPSAKDDYVSSIYRERVMLASGRFMMIDDHLGFRLVP